MREKNFAHVSARRDPGFWRTREFLGGPSLVVSGEFLAHGGEFLAHGADSWVMGRIPGPWGGFLAHEPIDPKK